MATKKTKKTKASKASWKRGPGNAYLWAPRRGLKYRLEDAEDGWNVERHYSGGLHSLATAAFDDDAPKTLSIAKKLAEADAKKFQAFLAALKASGLPWEHVRNDKIFAGDERGGVWVMLVNPDEYEGSYYDGWFVDTSDGLRDHESLSLVKAVKAAKEKYTELSKAGSVATKKKAKKRPKKKTSKPSTKRGALKGWLDVKTKASGQTYVSPAVTEEAEGIRLVVIERGSKWGVLLVAIHDGQILAELDTGTFKTAAAAAKEAPGMILPGPDRTQTSWHRDAVGPMGRQTAANPCIGLHLHADDFGPLLAELERRPELRSTKANAPYGSAAYGSALRRQAVEGAPPLPPLSVARREHARWREIWSEGFERGRRAQTRGTNPYGNYDDWSPHTWDAGWIAGMKTMGIHLNPCCTMANPVFGCAVDPLAQNVALKRRLMS